jgi:hypothetical protein
MTRQRRKRYNPGQPRDPGGEDGGQWVSGPAGEAAAIAGDALKLAGRIDLAPDEHLIASGKVDGSNGGIRIAALTRGGERYLRFGAGGEGYGKRDAAEGIRAWDGNPSRPPLSKSERQRLVDESDELDAEYDSASPERKRQIDDRQQEIRDLTAEEDFNGTASLHESAARRLADRVRPAMSEAVEQLKVEDEAYEELQRLDGKDGVDPAVIERLRLLSRADNTESVTFVKGIVPGSAWGDVHFRVELDDPTVGPYLMLGVQPKNAPDDWGETRDWQGRFDAAETRKLLRLLDKMATTPLPSRGAELFGDRPKSATPAYTSPRPSRDEGRVNTKSFSRVEIKNADQGLVTAVFATFGVVDSDGDLTARDAFTEGAEAPISSYGHTSWNGALPVGKGRIRTTDTEAIVEGQFFMDTTHGRDAFLTVKQLGSLGQWSYGFDTLDSEPTTFKGRSARLLKRQLVHEFSPTLLGAGVNTRTLATKGSARDTGRGSGTSGPSPHNGGSPMGFAYKAAIKPHDTEITTAVWDAAAAVKGVSDTASLSDLRSMFAWVDPDADPELKSSYRFPHHAAPGAPANVRACLKGIAALNGARGGTPVPEADRKGVYDHLAAHLRDADREPPEFRDGTADGMKFNDEMTLVLYELDHLIDRASEVVALRAKKGRTPLSMGSSELLEWLDTDLKRLKHLLTPTEDEAAIEYLRFLRSTLGEQTS